MAISGKDMDEPVTPGWDAAGHCDADGLTNLLEYQIGTRACRYDTDGDRIGDGYEHWSQALDPLYARDGAPYRDEVDRYRTSHWHTLRRMAGLLDFQALTQRLLDFGKEADEYLRGLLLPDVTELPLETLAGLFVDVTDAGELAGVALALGDAVFWYNDHNVLATLFNYWPTDCTGTNLGQEPGYVYILAYGLSCSTDLGDMVGVLDPSGTPTAGVAYKLMDDFHTYYDAIHRFALNARDNVLPDWGTYVSRIGGVWLPVLQGGGGVPTFFQYTGFPKEDQALDFGARVWTHTDWTPWGALDHLDDYRDVGYSCFVPPPPLPPLPYACGHTQLGDRYVLVHQVKLTIVQIAIQTYQSLVFARRFMQGIIDIDPTL